MNTAPLKPMDLYSHISIPFDVAAYCRGHKYSPEAVALARKIKARDAAKAAVDAAEEAVATAENEVKAAIEAARKRMDGDAHA